jgi:hypothetical protein
LDDRFGSSNCKEDGRYGKLDRQACSAGQFVAKDELTVNGEENWNMEQE